MFKHVTSIFTKDKIQTLPSLRTYIDNESKKIDMRRVSDLDFPNYIYTTEIAQNELGLEAELVENLLEDFIAQIINTKDEFLQLIDTIEEDQKSNKIVNYTPLRELAHRNLGVAKNLRIEDAKVFLHELMKKDDVPYLRQCLVWLEVCVMRLNPGYAFKVKQLLETKKML
jgi:hypothetical protein